MLSRCCRANIAEVDTSCEGVYRVNMVSTGSHRRGMFIIDGSWMRIASGFRSMSSIERALGVAWCDII